MTLEIYNTLTKRKDPFRPRDPDHVQMFVCGPTVYDLSHIGHARTYTHFDFIARYLRQQGFGVHYLQNVTDVDDKIIRRANEMAVDPRQLAEKYEELYREDMEALRNTSVDTYARAHDYIDAIIDQIQRLIERGHAYELSDEWYFDLSSFPRYGRLSGRTEIQPEDSVARIDESPKKRHPGDFALWKSRQPGEPYWSTALGEGRPGWHIEDTAITESFFDPRYDLHGGAVDLIFPHHEAEIAQMEAASGMEPLARYWVHAGLVRQDGSKMSKSEGNFLTIRDALKQFDFRTLRFSFLSNHYRSPMEFSTEVLHQARRARRRVENFARSADGRHTESEGSQTAVREARSEFFDRLEDDFDTPGALGVLFNLIRASNRSDDVPGLTTLSFLDEVEELFVTFKLEQEPLEDDAVRDKITEREHLRASGHYEQADAIREALESRGILLEDTPEGTRWRRTGE